MKLFSALSFFIILISASASASASDKDIKNANEIIKNCMNIKYSPDVIDCMMKKEKETKKEYNKEFEEYLKSELNQDEISHDKESFTKLARKAKEGWDLYSESECLAEAASYEKNKDGYNATYNICLIEKNIQRIKYYKENKH